MVKAGIIGESFDELRKNSLEIPAVLIVHV